jgi:hypothetical protein
LQLEKQLIIYRILTLSYIAYGKTR